MDEIHVRSDISFKGDAETCASIDIPFHEPKHFLQKFLEELKMRKKHLEKYIKHVGMSLLATVVAILKTIRMIPSIIQLTKNNNWPIDNIINELHIVMTIDKSCMNIKN